MKLAADIDRAHAVREDYLAAKNKFASDPGSLDRQELIRLKAGTEREIAKGADGSWRTAGLVPTLKSRLQEIDRILAQLASATPA